MGMSEISEYFKLYFFLTVLFFLFLRQTLYSNKQLANLFFRSIVLGAIAPFFMLIVGGVPTLMVLGVGIIVLAVLFMARQIHRHSGATTEDTSPMLASLSLTSSSLVQEEAAYRGEADAELNAFVPVLEGDYEETDKENSIAKTETVVEMVVAEERQQTDQAQRLRDLSIGNEPVEANQPAQIDEAVEHEELMRVAEEELVDGVADEPEAGECEEIVESIEARKNHEMQQELSVSICDEALEEEALADEEVVLEEENVENEAVVPQMKLTEEERRQVNSYYLKAVEAVAKEDHASAVEYFRQALSYPLQLAARYMITVDYEKTLKHFGLYGKIRAEWNELLRQLDTGCITGQIREKYEADIIRRVQYLEELDAALRRYGKPSLPWSLVPTAVRSEVDKAISKK
ncbi:hypothetical protein DFP93_11963 [Aneurinibacillus soli]|uniref:Uncharacterized protein n=2 Tax=Aneurinibacillus soli TaxID=1500254 RepID=A0A0U5BD69_9BACL|nr:hypothetical protein DFP93_11963 [Aneurinibacillus soli]BAU29558.1 hypothetical protein CB4_03758 [Aneurinibacillus soli]